MNAALIKFLITFSIVTITLGESVSQHEIITLKEINSTDVADVIPRRDWVTDQVWDMYDDQYSKEVQGINLISGGYGYSSNPAIFPEWQSKYRCLYSAHLLVNID